ncbi:hypothetical protein [Aneurinibacillus sp. REN35]|uniref:hypothetical protein n=1 Tax=Aneurinibacillus sp. REN35 TaxID=3237286 RepID=UPI0035299868
MNLADTLVYADIRQLHQLASACGLTCNRHSKHELIQSLHRQLTSAAFCQDVHGSLVWEEKRFLLSLIFERRKEYSYEALLSRARKSFKEEIRSGEHEKLLNRMLVNGWLFRLQRSYAIMYVMPDDLRIKWQEIFVKEVKDAAYGNYTKPALYRDDTHVMVYDLQQLLGYVQKHKVPLSKEGVMHRKQQQKVLELMAVCENLVESKEWRFGYGRRFRSYPDRLALLYDFAYHHRWLTEDENVLTLTEMGVEQIQKGLREEVAEQLVAFWLLSYRKAIPVIESLWRFIAAVCDEAWMEEASLILALQDWIRPFYYDTEKEVIRRRLLSMMVHLGILQRGVIAESSIVYTVTNWGKSLVNNTPKL